MTKQQHYHKRSLYSMATPVAIKRLTREYAELQKEAPQYITARPNEQNILEWHYIIDGPPDSPYHGGEYHGTLLFPSNFPWSPPGIRMITPNGRFQTNARLCLSISDYHPESWNPAWSVASILVGLVSFMLGTDNTTGATQSTNDQKKDLAKKSHEWNRKQSTFRILFPERVFGDTWMAGGTSSSSGKKVSTTSASAATAKPDVKEPVVKPKQAAPPAKKLPPSPVKRRAPPSPAEPALNNGRKRPAASEPAAPSSNHKRAQVIDLTDDQPSPVASSPRTSRNAKAADVIVLDDDDDDVVLIL